MAGGEPVAPATVAAHDVHPLRERIVEIGWAQPADERSEHGGRNLVAERDGERNEQKGQYGELKRIAVAEQNEDGGVEGNPDELLAARPHEIVEKLTMLTVDGQQNVTVELKECFEHIIMDEG